MRPPARAMKTAVHTIRSTIISDLTVASIMGITWRAQIRRARTMRAIRALIKNGSIGGGFSEG